MERVAEARLSGRKQGDYFVHYGRRPDRSYQVEIDEERQGYLRDVGQFPLRSLVLELEPEHALALLAWLEREREILEALVR